MRDSYTREFLVDGKIMEATVITDPNVDDVLRTEARLTAHEIAGAQLPTRRVSREIRDLLIRFGVQR